MPASTTFVLPLVKTLFAPNPIAVQSLHHDSNIFYVKIIQCHSHSTTLEKK
jgi:hypothetical protein